jgi:GAF domain-containing protein
MATGGSAAARDAGDEHPPHPAPRRVTDERAYLYDVIRTISSGPDLDAILRATVRLVTEATGCHACFIYFAQEDRLALRAASAMYAHLEGKIEIPHGEGLTGWVARTRRSTFIKENALEDARVQAAYFPELEEELFQSLVSVPIFARAGDVIGVITLHAEAPHEFAPPDLEFLEHTASLIAGAVENARLYEDARTRIVLLTDLSNLAQAIGSTGSEGEVLEVLVEGARDALGAARCEVYMLDAADRLVLRAARPERNGSAPLDARRVWLDALRPPHEGTVATDASHLARALWGDGAEGTPIFAPLTVGEDHLGFLGLLATTRARDARRALPAIASHAAVAIRQHRLIEGLRERNMVKDFFEELSLGTQSPALAAQAKRLGCDLETEQVAIRIVAWEGDDATPGRGAESAHQGGAPLIGWAELASHIQSLLAPRFPGVLLDERERSIRGILPIGDRSVSAVAELVRGALGTIASSDTPPLSVGISDACRGAGAFRSGFEEAQAAAEVGALIRRQPGVTTYEDLGPYRYVLTSEESVRDRYQTVMEQLADYDDRRGTRLLETLETYLERRGNVLATSRILYIHPNTLRQRLSRIEHLTELQLDGEDWLSLAIAVKVVKLRAMRSSTNEGGPG